MIRTPFLRLDEMRRQDSDNVLNQVVDASRQFGEAPMIASKLLEKQQERERLADRDKALRKLKERELGDKRTIEEKKAQNAYDLSQKELEEKIRHNKATENTAIVSEKRRKDSSDYKQNSSTLANIALGEITDPKNKEADEDTIIEGILMHPSNTGVSREEAIKAYYIAKRKVENDEADLTMKKAKTDRFNRRSVPSVRQPKPQNLDSKTIRDLAELETSSDRLKAVAVKLNSADTGLFNDLSEKFGQIVGIQDDTTRMAYLSEVNRLLKERSGAQVTPEEYQRLIAEFPDWKADKDILAERILSYAEDKDRMYDAIIRTSTAGGRNTTNFGTRVPKGPPPPRKPGEKITDYGTRLRKEEGFSAEEVVKIVMGVK